MQLRSLLILVAFPFALSAQPLDLRECATNDQGVFECSAISTEVRRAPVKSRGSVPRSIAFPRALSLSVEVSTAEVTSDSDGQATRIFAGPNQYPPKDFGAYAIVAFRSGSDASDRDRYMMFCRAYSLSIPESGESDLPQERQLVTIWPLVSAEVSAQLDAVQGIDERCEMAVSGYGNTIALRAIANARKVSLDIRSELTNQRGPFLLAWNPASAYGEDDALILRLNLSDIDNMTAAKRNFEFWVQKIEMSPELWENEWQQESIRQQIADSADRYGQIIIDFFGG